MAGVAAAALYGPCVATVGQKFAFGFSRQYVSLTLSGNTAPMGWAYEYLYPTTAIEIRQLMPMTVADLNNPLPQNWSLGNSPVSSVATKVIWSNLANATAFVTNLPPVPTWDPLFREEVVRLLASELAIAVAGKPDTARDFLSTAGSFGQMAESRPG